MLILGMGLVLACAGVLAEGVLYGRGASMDEARRRSWYWMHGMVLGWIVSTPLLWGAFMSEQRRVAFCLVCAALALAHAVYAFQPPLWWQIGEDRPKDG